MDNKEFIKKLSIDQWKGLIEIIIGVETMFGINITAICPDEQWQQRETIYIHFDTIKKLSYGVLPYEAYLSVNDFSLELVEDGGVFKYDHSDKLYAYLASQFGEEYANHLYEYRIQQATQKAVQERENLLASTSKNVQQRELVQK